MTFRIIPPKKLPQRPRARGYSLVETLIYIAMLVMMLTALLTAVNLMMRDWQESQGRIQLANAGRVSLNRLLYDIRGATGVDAAGSSFGTTSGQLKLTSVDASGNSTTTSYTLQGGALMVAQGSASAVPLTPSGVGVQGFTLYEINTGNSIAIRIVLQLQAATTTKPVSATFYDTAVMRASY